MQIDPQYVESYYGSRYHKLQEDSTDFHNAVNYLLDTMKQSNMVMETEINYLNSVSVPIYYLALTLFIRILNFEKS